MLTLEHAHDDCTGRWTAKRDLVKCTRCTAKYARSNATITAAAREEYLTQQMEASANLHA